MKKSLFTICGALAVSAALAQTPSPSWTITQNSNFPMVSAGTRFIDAVNPNVVWAVGYDGTAPSRNYNFFTRTTNGGTSFSGGVIFQGTNTAVGDTNSWVLANMEGIDANTAWVSAYKKSTQNMGGIFRTTNGGTNWTNMSAPGMFTNTAAFADVITFVTPSVGVAIGDPNGTGNEFEIWRTTDGGNSWTKIPGANIPNPSSTNEFGLVNVYCKQGTSNIWFGTNAGRIYRSTDGGLTWSVATVAASTTGINDIAFTDPNNGVCYAFTSGSTFEMYNTTDGGATWTQIVTVSPNVGMNDLNAVPGTNYFVSAGAGTGNNIISYSQDNGVTWTDWGSVSIQYLNIDFADGANGWAGSFSDPANAAIGGIYKYSDVALTSTVAPTAAFTLPSFLCSTGGAATVTPTDMSTGTSPLTYSWSASAGAIVASSTSSAPIVSFTANGTYTVSLSLSNTYGSNSSSQVITILSCSAPSVAFSAPTNTLCQKVAVNFTNTTTGSPTPTFSWSTSPAANVTISPSPSASNVAMTFSTPGTYSVTLWASNSGGTAQVTHTVVISNCAPVAGFTIPATGCTNTAISATNTSSGATSYLWSSNPSAFSIVSPTSPNPNFTFNNPNTYTITLTATNASGSTVITHTISIGCSGLNENSLSNSLNVFPNPAKDVLNVEVSTSDIYSVSLSNIIGKVIFADKSAKDKTTISLNNVAAGVYFLTIDVKGQKTTKKIIVE